MEDLGPQNVTNIPSDGNGEDGGTERLLQIVGTTADRLEQRIAETGILEREGAGERVDGAVEEVRRYLAQQRRTLRRGGRCEDELGEQREQSSGNGNELANGSHRNHQMARTVKKPAMPPPTRVPNNLGCR